MTCLIHRTVVLYWIVGRSLRRWSVVGVYRYLLYIIPAHHAAAKQHLKTMSKKVTICKLLYLRTIASHVQTLNQSRIESKQESHNAEDCKTRPVGKEESRAACCKQVKRVADRQKYAVAIYWAC